MEAVVTRTGDNLPPVLRHRDVAKAFYGVVNEVLGRLAVEEDDVLAGRGGGRGGAD